MKLILMTTPTFFVEEDSIINSLFEEGLETLHLRKPEEEPIFSERLLTLLPSKWHKKIVAHDHFYLKNEYSLKGIHLSDWNSEPPPHYKGQLSRTCRQMDLLASYKSRYDYVFLGPIFKSISEPGKEAAFTMQQIQKASRKGLIDRKVYAIGGVRLDHVPMLKELGFGGVVVCGDLWNRFDHHISYDYKVLIDHFKRLQHAVDE